MNLKSEEGILAEVDTFYWYDTEYRFSSDYSPAVFTLKDACAEDVYKRQVGNRQIPDVRHR